jgi:uncharacterized repeat protein (TIGR03803 family)
LVLTNNTLFGTTEFGGNGVGTVFAIDTDGSGYTNLHAFASLVSLPPSGNPDGANPTGNLIVAGGLLYGTTENGGSASAGTVFVATLDGTVVKTLYSFTNGTDGGNPAAGLTLSGATLYGTAKNGGKVFSGTIFAINTNGTGFTNLYTFTNGTDGAYPAGSLVLSGNTLYGTAQSGGLDFAGTIFSIKTNGTGFASLHNFTFDDGEAPEAALTLVGGALFGTTSGGGTSFSGGLFAINTDGSNFTNFYSFTGLNDGSEPEAALIFSNNLLYGTASAGGTGGAGTVFAVDTNGLFFTNLYSFGGEADGMTPLSSLYLTNNFLYGTTEYGGVFSNGTVFAVGTDGKVFTNLYTFTGADDGGNPVAGLVGDALYGTTLNGGNAGDGALFVIQTDGTGFTNLHSFEPPSLETSGTNYDGAYSVASLFLSGDTLYGTAEYGGEYGNGTIFSVKTNGTGFTNIYTFTAGADGANPAANLILAGDVLYGTTEFGGKDDNGTVFSLHTDGSEFTVLYRFSGQSDGGFPLAGLALSGNTLYGTTDAGGLTYGTIFAINTGGTDFKTLYTFTGGSDGNGPQAPLTVSGNTLYGTAETGGSTGWGTVFSIQMNGSNFMLMHTFAGDPQGGSPYGALLLSGTTLYGTTFSGGLSNNGTVYAVQTDGAGFTNLFSFTNYASGAYPAAGLILSGNSTLYGTAEEGGSSGSGAIFAIQTDGAGYSDVHDFVPYSILGASVNSDGAYPLAGLIYSEGTFYGTAFAGGSGGYGTVYSVLTNGSNFATLYNFTNGIDGAFPEAALTRLSNTLFSTSSGGGTYGKGTVFTIQTNGTGFMSLHSFGNGTDGAYPVGSLLLGSNVLYGTTSGGGLSNSGTIFAINTDGSDYTILYNFTGGSDGAAPLGGLAVWSNSWLLCTASAGGISNLGTLFALQLTPQPAKLGDPIYLSRPFLGGSDGDYPSASLTPAGGLGGSTAWGDGGGSSSWGSGGSSSWGNDGGSSCCDSGSSCEGGFLRIPYFGDFYLTTGGIGRMGDYGTVTHVSFSPQVAGGYTVLDSFLCTDATGGGGDGNLLNWRGYLWGTFESGGTSGFGTIAAYSSLSKTLVADYNFLGGDDGGVPASNLYGLRYDLYGPAAYYGRAGHGVIVGLNPCDGTEFYPSLTLNAAIYNSTEESLFLNFSDTFPMSTPQNLTSRLWINVYGYNGTGTSSMLGSFDINTQGGGMFTGSHRMRVGAMMPSSVSLSVSGPCGESPLSSTATVYESPSITYTFSGYSFMMSWTVTSPYAYTLETSTSIGPDAEWTPVSPAPVLSGNKYSTTVTPGLNRAFFKLEANSF